MDNNYTDLRFNNDQLMKLVSSAEILLQHLYDLVSSENKVFIDQWFCYKQEYDETCSNNSQIDVNENIPECSILSRIDEVSENEKFSSSLSSNTHTSESCFSAENSDNNKNYLIDDMKRETKSSENQLQSEVNVHLSQIDSDLLEYMTEYKLFTDGFVSDWFKTLKFSAVEIREYLSWLENREYKRLWTNIYNNARKKNDLEDGNMNCENFKNNINDFKEIPIETSQTMKKSFQPKHHARRNLLVQYNNENRPETIDQQICRLYNVRQVLLRTRENINTKLKKDEMDGSSEFKRSVKVDVAFEIIDTAIEMKERVKLGYNIEDKSTFNDEIDSMIADSLHILTLNEIQHLMMTFLQNFIEIRKCSCEGDKQILKLDSEISNQKFLIWRLYMIINENKRSYENQCLTLHKEFEQKLQLLNKTTTDESNDSAMESIAKIQGRKLLSIIEKNDVPESSHSDIRDMKDDQNVISEVHNIPVKSLKTLKTVVGTPSGTKVTRSKKKLIIQTQKH